MLQRVDELGFSNLKLSNFWGAVSLLNIVKMFLVQCPFCTTGLPFMPGLPTILIKIRSPWISKLHLVETAILLRRPPNKEKKELNSMMATLIFIPSQINIKKKLVKSFEFWHELLQESIWLKWIGNKCFGSIRN